MAVEVSNEEFADIVDVGADYIEKWGWHQGDLYDWQAVSSYKKPARLHHGRAHGRQQAEGHRDQPATPDERHDDQVPCTPYRRSVACTAGTTAVCE